MARFSSCLGLVTLLATASAASGTPLPAPPFSAGGSIAPSKDVLRLEERVGKLLLQSLKRRGTCDRIAVIELQLAYEPAHATKSDDAQARWTGCAQRTDQYYASNRDTLLSKGLPSCLTAATIDTMHAVYDGVLGIPLLRHLL